MEEVALSQDLVITADEFDLDSPSQESNSQKEMVWRISIDEVARLLLDDDEDQVGSADGAKIKAFDDEFFAGIFDDECGYGSGSESDDGIGKVTSPDSGERREAESAEADDPVSRKRRRQLRNKDSAMKSRERKKMYVKELEIKSKYLESECRSLDYALRCYVAENHALHQRLQMGRPFCVPAAKQESAVLFVESLLLGSLFWLMSIVCLSFVSSLQIRNPRDGSRLGRGLALEAIRSRTVARSRNLGPELDYELVIMRRRCRGMRTRMKLCMFPCVFLVA